MDECIFCKISHGEIISKKIYENCNFFSILDANPKVKGHSLVISKDHIENILSLPDNLSQDLLDCIKNTASKLMDEENVEGFNVLSNNFDVAGQIINHLHFHVLPRRKNDGVKLV